MHNFKVIYIVDGDTFDIEPKWKFEGKSGSRVRPAGYDAPELGGIAAAAARSWLTELLLNKTVQLGEVHGIHFGRLVCDVFIDGRNLVEYYEDYKDNED